MLPGRTRQSEIPAYDLKYQPIILKELALASNITQGEIAAATKTSRATANLCFNKGYIPPTVKGFKEIVVGMVQGSPKAQDWLKNQGLDIGDIWSPAAFDMKSRHVEGFAKRISQGRKPKPAAMQPGNPDIIKISWEVEMLSQVTLKHFKLFRNPFIDDIQKDADIYMSDEHRYIEAAMLDASRHGGFLAIIGEVGSGKSVMRRKVIEQLRHDGDMLVIYPQTIDKTRLTAGSICDAIIYDISSEKAKCKLEDKSRQVQRLLLDRAKSGYRACLIIEEAHDLNVQTLKFLKRFYELEDGYRKLLGIVLVGQTELKEMFDEAQHVDMREVIRRVQVAEIQGLNGYLREYLNVKFKRIGGKVEELFTDDSLEVLSRRLTTMGRDGKSKISHAYPLLVNNYTARAMNLAAEMGEPQITADVMEAI